tara:strand:+ start:359 stop:559 length:201 start_codon:yes stop_codon:yes gene_type:complete
MDIVIKKNTKKINLISATNIILTNKILSKKYLTENNIFYDIPLSPIRVNQKDIDEKWTIIEKKELD